jgi:hypothetical protein
MGSLFVAVKSIWTWSMPVTLVVMGVAVCCESFSSMGLRVLTLNMDTVALGIDAVARMNPLQPLGEALSSRHADTLDVGLRAHGGVAGDHRH